MPAKPVADVSRTRCEPPGGHTEANGSVAMTSRYPETSPLKPFGRGAEVGCIAFSALVVGVSGALDPAFGGSHAPDFGVGSAGVMSLCPAPECELPRLVAGVVEHVERAGTIGELPLPAARSGRGWHVR